MHPKKKKTRKYINYSVGILYSYIGVLPFSIYKWELKYFLNKLCKMKINY